MGKVLKREIILTEDGSTTIYIPELQENYHSIHGAVQESMHVFINSGLKQINKKQISIFEMGLGTGLNCLLTFLHSKNQEITYYALEKYPVEPEITKSLNFTEQLNLTKTQQNVFKNIHVQEWNNNVTKIANNFRLIKTCSDINLFQTKLKFDIIFFDAFAPDIQPNLWTKVIFKKMFSMLNSNGILVTYSAKGQVRRNMADSGFTIEKLPGPPGKREMIRAIKPGK
jgi:tRNA U34 5-methylaminomethyl-2-thiouridine-forming methyltransferase MnmC